MIGSTDHLDEFDPAISIRASRFDRKHHFNRMKNSESLVVNTGQ